MAFNVLRNRCSQGSHAGEKKKNKSVSHRCELINLFYLKFYEQIFIFCLQQGLLVTRLVIVQCLAGISGDSVLANNDFRYLLSSTVRHSYQLFEPLGEL